MSLLTPVLKDDDLVFPGENWFFYWKTSSSLWKQKLEAFSGDRVVAPINWSIHSDTGENYDFAGERPETNLKKLENICLELGKELIFFLPLTPAPFLPNGGVPHLLARCLAMNVDEMVYGIVDPEGAINKLYTFFDPRVFKAYRTFVMHMGRYFRDNDIHSSVWGFNSGYIQNGEHSSYFTDRSRVFDRAFSRYLVAKRDEHEDGDSLESHIDEKANLAEFSSTIYELYFDSARELLRDNWEGAIDVAFLGGGVDSFWERVSGVESGRGEIPKIFEAICNNILVSSVLLPASCKKGILGRQLNDLVLNSFFQERLNSNNVIDDDLAISSRSLVFFDIIKTENEGVAAWQQCGLLPFVLDKFKWSFKIKSVSSLCDQSDSEEVDTRKITFFDGKWLDKSSFQTMLRMFMNGSRIVLSKEGLSNELSKRLELFYLENSIDLEKVNYQVNITSASLGSGQIICFDGQQLSDLDSSKKVKFWERLIGSYGLFHIPVECGDKLDVFWRTRSIAPMELNYEEVRRVSIYNGTSYKQKAKINFQNNFALLKVLDEVNVKSVSGQNGLELELLPEGSISVDFGLYS